MWLGHSNAMKSQAFPPERALEQYFNSVTEMGDDFQRFLWYFLFVRREDSESKILNYAL